MLVNIIYIVERLSAIIPAEFTIGRLAACCV
jgi:hypothetical protein